jgi:hypothetical protein
LVKNGSGNYIHNAVRKYKVKNFSAEVVQRCKTLNSLDLAEQKWIKKLHCCVYDPQYGGGYNLTFGGGGFRGKHSTASKAKISAALRVALKNPLVRAKFSAGTRKRWEDVEYRKYIVEHLNAQWDVPSRRVKQAGYMTARNIVWWADEAYRMERSAASRRLWKNKEYRVFMAEVASKGRRIAFADPIKRARWLIARHPGKYSSLKFKQVVRIAKRQIEDKKNVVHRSSNKSNKDRRQEDMCSPKKYAEFLVSMVPHKYGKGVMSFKQVVRIAAAKIQRRIG